MISRYIGITGFNLEEFHKVVSLGIVWSGFMKMSFLLFEGAWIVWKGLVCFNMNLKLFEREIRSASRLIKVDEKRCLIWPRRRWTLFSTLQGMFSLIQQWRRVIIFFFTKYFSLFFSWRTDWLTDSLTHSLTHSLPANLPTYLPVYLH